MAQHYDVAVVGGAPGTLVAALMLARGGRRVLVIDHGHEQVRSLPCYPVGDMSMITRLHDELGVTPPPTMRPQGLGTLQVILPRHRLTILGGRDNLAAELKRACPQDAQTIDDVLQKLSQDDRAICHFLMGGPRLPPETVLNRLHLWHTGRAIKELRGPVEGYALGPEHPLRQLVQRCLPLLHHNGHDKLAPWAASHLVAQTLMGSAPVTPNEGALMALLWHAVQAAGIEIHRPQQIPRMHVTGKRLSHLELREEHKTVRADHYIYGHHGLSNPLSWPGAAAQELRAATICGSWMRRQWRVQERLVSRALGPVMWHLDGRATGRTQGAAVADANRPDEPFVVQRHDASGGDVMLTISAPLTVPRGASEVGHESREGSLQWARGAWRRLEPRLRRTLPYLPKSEGDSAMGLSPVELLPKPLFAPQGAISGLLTGVAGRSCKTPLRNVVHCGPDVVPGLGLEGEYLAAAAAAALVKKRAGWA